MRKSAAISAVSVAALAFSTLALADYRNGPNPYDPNENFGTFTRTFDTNPGYDGFPGPNPGAVSTGSGDDPALGMNMPSIGYSGTVANPLTGDPAPGNLAWGGWNRGDVGTVWAEWDSFNADSLGGFTSTADNGQNGSGSSGTSSATFSWAPGTFRASSGGLYSPSNDPIGYEVNIDVSGLTGLGQVVMQVEQTAPFEARWNGENEVADPQDPGNFLPENSVYLPDNDPVNLSLDGGSAVARDQMAYTMFLADFPSTFGPVDLVSGVFIWNDIDLTGIDSLTINFDNPVHSSLAQVAVDIGASPVPIPAAAWLFGSAVLGLVGISRRRKAA